MAIDIIIGLILVAAVVTGAMTGLVRQLGTLVAFVVAVLACRLSGPAIQSAVGRMAEQNTQLITVLCYVLVFIVAFVLVLVVARLLHATVSALKLGAINRLLGALFRLGLWLVVMSACINIYLAVAPADSDRFNTPERPWRALVVNAAPALVGYIDSHANH